LVLIPPSLTKAPDGRRSTRAGLFDAALAEPRRVIREALQKRISSATSKELEVLLNARGPLLAKAIKSSERLGGVESRALPAWRRYQGVVWTYLDAETLSAAQRRRILVPSGLYGLVSGEDPIGDYRLGMNSSLAPLGRLATFWRSELTNLLDAYKPRAPLINFLTLEHAASVDLSALSKQRTVINVRFVSSKDDRAVGHDAKAVKGVLARKVLVEGLESLDATSWQGWHVQRDGRDIVVYAPDERAVWGRAT
jgi:cytoplasmic iron level regulating protein YaaA (DUF328/UPF0246 family)